MTRATSSIGSRERGCCYADVITSVPPLEVGIESSRGSPLRMPVPSLDFGLFIAYVVPGVITLYGLSLVSVTVRELWRGEAGQRTLGGAVIIALIALVLGRIVSIGRVATVDSTFGVALPFVSCRHAPHLGAIGSVEPDYRRFVDSGRREAFLLAIANEQRPYQFGGNTAIALLLTVSCWIVSLRGRDRAALRVILTVTAVIALSIVLYAGARISHYRFVRAVAVLNGGDLRALDRTGQPCR